MSEPKKRMVKLKWQTIASVIKKLGYAYQSSSAYSHDEGFRCQEHFNGGVRVIWYSAHGYNRETKIPATEAMPKIAAALREAGYDVDYREEWINQLTVTKEAPPAPPAKPFHEVYQKAIAMFEWPMRRKERDFPNADRRTVTLTRTIHHTHEGTFPINEWTVRATASKHDSFNTEETYNGAFDSGIGASDRFAHLCRLVALDAIYADYDASPTIEPPSPDLIPEHTAAWEAAMAEYEQQYPGPQPEIA